MTEEHCWHWHNADDGPWQRGMHLKCCHCESVKPLVDSTGVELT